MIRELESCEMVIEKLTGKRAHLFRPPRGLMDGEVLLIATEEGVQDHTLERLRRSPRRRHPRTDGPSGVEAKCTRWNLPLRTMEASPSDGETLPLLLLSSKDSRSADTDS